MTIATPSVYGPRPFMAPSAPTRPIRMEKLLRPHRREALAGINYAEGLGYVIPAREAPDAGRTPMTQEPKPSRPEAHEFTDSPLVSINGRRLPLRAIPYRELNRRFWSQGKTLFSTERATARELLAHEKQPQDMTLEELVATQDREPLTESKRAFLTTGVGVLHLDATDYEEGSIGEAIAEQLDGLTFDAEPAEPNIDETEHDALRYGTPYELLDPITAKQIDWEQRAWHDSMVVTLKRDGDTVTVTPKLPQDQFIAFAKRAIRELLPDPGSDEHLAHRVQKLSAEMVRILCSRFDRFVANEIDRAMSPDDNIAHNSYETIAGLIAHHKPYRWIEITPGHFERRLHVAPEEKKFGPWHGVIQDRSEVAIFDSTGPDEDVENLMGRPECPMDYQTGCMGYLVMPENDEFSPFCDTCGTYINFGEFANSMGRLTQLGWRTAA